jgi:hypothetical protein
MKKLIAFCLFLIYGLFISANEIRQELDIAWKDEKTANMLIKKLEANLNTETKGYLAAAYMMKSNHASMPWTKLNFFYKGKKMLDQSIIEQPENIEWRLFRYEVQIRIPKGLNYDNTKEDKIILQNYISNPQNKKKDEILYNKLIALNLPKR